MSSISKETKQSKFPSLIYTIILLILGIAIVICARIFVKIQNLEIEGLSSYAAADIISESQLQAGMNLYGLPEEEITERLLTRFPMIEKVQFDRRGFRDLILVITEKKPTFYTFSDGVYLYLASDFTVLKSSQTPISFQDTTPISLTLPQIKTALAGAKIDFVGTEDHHWMIEFSQQILKFSFSNQITAMDLTNRFALSATYQSNLTIAFGNRFDLEEKAQKIQRILKSQSAEKLSKIDVSDQNHPFFVRIA